MYMDPDDPIHMPLTFPVQDMGEPTPGTTTLDEPPADQLPLAKAPPPSPEQLWPSTGWTTPEADTLPTGSPKFIGWVKAHHLGNAVRLSMEVLQSQQKKLANFIYQEIRASEVPVPMTLVRIEQHERLADQVKAYHTAQLQAGLRFSMSTLITGGSQILVEGLKPKICVLDTGCSAIILGRSFAHMMERCSYKNLTYGDTFVTAGGTEEKLLGRTKSQLTICLAKGTDAETTVTSIAIIADTNAYDIILGMDFLGACFGYVDPLTEEFIWRTDCHETAKIPTNIARLPAKCRATMRRERRHV